VLAISRDEKNAERVPTGPKRKMEMVQLKGNTTLKTSTVTVNRNIKSGMTR